MVKLAAEVSGLICTCGSFSPPLKGGRRVIMATCGFGSSAAFFGDGLGEGAFTFGSGFVFPPLFTVRFSVGEVEGETGGAGVISGVTVFCPLVTATSAP